MATSTTALPTGKGAARPSERPARTAPRAARQPIDTAARLVTPERIEFVYPLAGPFRRAFGYLIDVLFIAVVLTILFVFTQFYIAMSGSPSAYGPLLAASFLLYWGYWGFCEGLFNGRTLGKLAIGVRVLTTQGVPITPTQAMIRSLIGIVDGPMPFLFVPGMVSFVMTRRFQRLGDLAAGTMVVIEETKLGSKLLMVDAASTAGLLDHLPMRVAGSSDLARAVSDYVKGRGRYGPSLREEMAEHLAGPLRVRYNLPASSADAVLCAYYHRLFLEG